MLTPSSLIAAINPLKSGGCLDDLKSRLSSLGFSSGELAALESQLSNLMKVNISNPDLQGLIDEVGDNLAANLKSLATEYHSVKKDQAEKKAREAHDVQNARKSISIKEPAASGSKTTSVPSIQPANYSTKEDYPDTYGFIDSVKNWFKINKRKGHAEFVHQSTTQIKIDKAGNVTMFIKGSLKQIVTGDYYLEVGGSRDVVVKGQKHENVKGNVDEKFGGNQTTNVSGVVREKASQIHHN